MSDNDLAYLGFAELEALTGDFDPSDYLAIFDVSAGKVKKFLVAGIPEQRDSVNSAAIVRTKTITATLAELNAGKAILAAQTGIAYRVLNYTARVVGAFAAATGILIQDSNGTPVVVTTIAVAGLTNGAVLQPSSSNTTIGAAFAGLTTANKDLNIIKNGIDLTTGTSITITVTYEEVAA